MQSNEVKRRKGMKSVVQLILCGHIHWRWTKGRGKERTDGQTCGKGEGGRGPKPTWKAHTQLDNGSSYSPLADSNEISISTTLIKRWETSVTAVDEGIPENSPHARTHVSSVTAGFIKRHIGYRGDASRGDAEKL